MKALMKVHSFARSPVFRFNSPVLRAGVTCAIIFGLAFGAWAVPARADTDWALQFDGSTDFVVLNTTENIIGSGWETTKSVSLWVKPTGPAPLCPNVDPGSCDLIFGDRPRWWGVSIGELNGLGINRIWVWNFDGNYDFVGFDYTPDEWVNVSLVHDNGNLQAYRNGVLMGTVPSGFTSLPGTYTPVLHIGGMISGPTKVATFEGQIDNVSIWNRPLTQDEVVQNMFQALTGDEAGLKAYYRMSDGSGLSLTDDSQYDWNGSLRDGNQFLPGDGNPPQWVPSTVPTDTVTTFSIFLPLVNNLVQ